ncbi:MAG: GNAT family N-acetyltransferase [Methanomicrobiales archaeon]|nr:GNAT family N-acetyltransferase [Methanomicrobiales archaeon]
MKLITSSCILREWVYRDRITLTKNANHPEIAQWMRDGFPSPYSLEDADNFIEMATGGENNQIYLAIDLNGEVVGGIGVRRLGDIYRKTAEIGYWITPANQGRGIVTDAVRAIVPYTFQKLDIIRIEAGVFHTNYASKRVLEKNGFVLEAVHQNAIYKNGQILDECLYVLFPGTTNTGKTPII